MKLYTKTGDKGKTGLFNGKRIDKDDLRIESYGTVDELNSILGLVRSFSKNKEINELVEELQHHLFQLGSDLATELDSKQELKIKRITIDDIHFLEREIDRMQLACPAFRNFILPGGTKAASFLHQARTVCRRAERRVVTLMKTAEIGENPQIFLNRLSDFLFIMARFENFLSGQDDIEWKK
jgi:cob(I)alamin adenosyltransferase